MRVRSEATRPAGGSRCHPPGVIQGRWWVVCAPQSPGWTHSPIFGPKKLRLREPPRPAQVRSHSGTAGTRAALPGPPPRAPPLRRPRPKWPAPRGRRGRWSRPELCAALPGARWATAWAAATSSGSTPTSRTRSGARRCWVSALRAPAGGDSPRACLGSRASRGPAALPHPRPGEVHPHLAPRGLGLRFWELESPAERGSASGGQRGDGQRRSLPRSFAGNRWAPAVCGCPGSCGWREGPPWTPEGGQGSSCAARDAVSLVGAVGDPKDFTKESRLFHQVA